MNGAQDVRADTYGEVVQMRRQRKARPNKSAPVGPSSGAAPDRN
jgi:hypothetical protein